MQHLDNLHELKKERKVSPANTLETRVRPPTPNVGAHFSVIKKGTTVITLELLRQLDPRRHEPLAVSAPVRVELDHPGPVRAHQRRGDVGVHQLGHAVPGAVQGDHLLFLRGGGLFLAQARAGVEEEEQKPDKDRGPKQSCDTFHFHIFRRRVLCAFLFYSKAIQGAHCARFIVSVTVGLLLLYTSSSVLLYLIFRPLRSGHLKSTTQTGLHMSFLALSFVKNVPLDPGSPPETSRLLPQCGNNNVVTPLQPDRSHCPAAPPRFVVAIQFSNLRNSLLDFPCLEKLSDVVRTYRIWLVKCRQ